MQNNTKIVNNVNKNKNKGQSVAEVPRIFSVAPMMSWTTRHCRYFHRQLSQHALLYSEMVTTGAILHGDHQRFLQYHPDEHPVALQIGGGDPNEIEKAINVAETYGYEEINLNVGCPSDRVQKGKIGATLMAEPELVADCFRAMKRGGSAKMTVKNRLSIDDMPEESIFHFVETVANAGCEKFIIHARKAFLKGLDPKGNRDVPPLRYELVYAVKERFPELEIIINGGIKTLEEATEHCRYLDGVMLGREAYQNPWILADVDEWLGDAPNTMTREMVVNQMIPYIEAEIAKGNHLKHIARHWMGLFHGQRGTTTFKRYLNDHINTRNEVAVVDEALARLL